MGDGWLRRAIIVCLSISTAIPSLTGQPASNRAVAGSLATDPRPPVGLTPRQEPGTCPDPLSIDLDAPRWTDRLAPGVMATQWWGRHPSHGQQVPIAAVAIAHGSALVTPTISRLPLPHGPQQEIRKSGALALTNGDYFRFLAQDRMTPRGVVVTGATPRFAPRGWSKVVAVDASGFARTAQVRIAGSVRVGNLSVVVTSLNDHLDAGQGAVYRAPWRGRVPPGKGTLVFVRNGAVQRMTQEGSSSSLRRGEWAFRVAEAAVLEPLRRGARVTTSITADARDGLSVLSASGHGGVILSSGRIARLCSAYEGLLRPRTALAWDDSGTMFLISAGTYLGADGNGIRWGGATKTQMAVLARALGATTAVTLDGGGSTVMLVRQGRDYKRLDNNRTAYARPVPVYWIVQRSGR